MTKKPMKSRERVLAALNHQEPDKIPRDFGGTSTTSIHIEAHSKLKQFLGLEGGPEGFLSLYGQTVAVDPRLLRLCRIGSKAPFHLETPLRHR